MREIKFRAWDKEQKKMLDDVSTWTDDFTGMLIALMQYTGLKDKNGKEIYEGDIVKYKNDKPDKVIFENGGFMTSRFYHRTPNNWKILLDELEVIGNIYENPELLTK